MSKLVHGFLFVVTWICQLSWDPWADHWKTNQPSKDELMMLAMMWPAPITKEIIYVDCEVNIWYEENWGDMTMACNCTQANLCDNCICCISSIWLKVATAVSNHERHVTFSFCFKWHGLHFFNSLKVATPVSNYERHCSGHQAICQSEQNLQIFIFDAE